ncbi:MAG: hypothetical protein BLM47_08040 [Candidatus Reconcilbacillus cellulovorans]|uniref:Copper amine oxidase-like N-terminal domain-containing protein n=1 Tax=Candidatus Reconcilbacillus cellulovorans TaxID=1906605 RepID=A0A2A6DZW6_9BACL|nr:MAG: hypothetical protein BLM47_08040 [Candidatus Reconcilbacillus cellulovorans]
MHLHKSTTARARTFKAFGRALACIAAVAVATAPEATRAASALSALTTSPIRIVVDGRETINDVPARLENGRVLAPVRALAEALGAEVRWDASTRTVFVTNRKPYDPPTVFPPVSPPVFPWDPPQQAGRDPNVDAPASATPEAILRAYFRTLSVASNLRPEQAGAAGGTVGMGTSPYTAAYEYWTTSWQNSHSLEQFISSWEGYAGLELLRLLPAGAQDGHPRFFVEIRTVEAVGDPPRFGVFYKFGFFTMTETSAGWRIADGAFEPENLAWRLGGHQPWLGDPVSVAIVAGLKHSIDEPPGEPVLEENADGTATVWFVGRDGRDAGAVRLVRREDGIWTVLETFFVNPAKPTSASGTSR